MTITDDRSARPRLATTVTTIAAAYAAAITAWWLANSTFHDTSWLTVAVTHLNLYAFVALPAIIALALGVWRFASMPQRRCLIVFLAVPSIAFACLHAINLFPRTSPQEPVRPLGVMTFNILNANPDITAVARLIENTGADLVCLQEVTDAHWQTLTEHLKATYPHTAKASPAFGGTTAIVSHHPLTDITEIPVPAGRPAIAATTTRSGTTVRVISVHLHYYGVSELASLTQWPDRIRSRSRDQIDQVHSIQTWLAGQPQLPTVVGADANSVRHSPTHRALTATLQETSAQTGWTPGHTPDLQGWTDDTRLRKLDYLWHKNITPVHTWTTKETANSDHQPVFGLFELLPKPTRPSPP